jgi:succinate dehydrogenase/fumarate reductase flavoprotein subunit
VVGRGGRVLTLSRRDLLKLAGTAGVVGAAGGCAATASAPGAHPRAGVSDRTWQYDVDVVVVGTGAAGGVAALSAVHSGAQTLVLEKALLFGGTTAKSGGVYFVPNNSFRQGKGDEPREETLRRMARFSYPQLYDPNSPTLGLPQNEYELLCALYDEGPVAVDQLAKMGALISQPAESAFGPMPDYFDPTREDATPRDRRLWPKKPDGSFGLGDEMVRQLKEGLAKYKVPVLMGHQVTRILQNDRGEVVGVEATKSDGTVVNVRARRGVVFASGGFTHNRELLLHYQPGPIFGGCAVPTNTGDFVKLASALGAKLGQMGSAWRAQVVLEQALQYSSTPDDVFMPPGDSMVLVNKHGRRVVDEKSNYNERTKIHFAWDTVDHEWTNLVLFMIYDERSAELFGGRFPIPAPGTTAPYVIEGATFEELSKGIDARLAEHASKLGGARLDPAFPSELKATVSRFNGFAKTGVDLDFRRGELLYDRMWHSRIWSFPNPGTKWPLPKKNPTMYPIASSGPYYAILLGAGTLDTNGGPVINAKAEVLSVQDQPIPGLFGAGNCIASPTGAYYYAGGGTLGPAVAFGWIAGREAAAQAPKELG